MAVNPTTLRMLEGLDGLPTSIATAVAEVRAIGQLLDADNLPPPMHDDIVRSVLAAPESERPDLLRRGIDALASFDARQVNAIETRRRFARHSEGVLSRAVDGAAEALLSAVAGPGWAAFADELHEAVSVLPPHFDLDRETPTAEEGVAYGTIVAALARIAKVAAAIDWLSPAAGAQLLKLPQGVTGELLLWGSLPHPSAYTQSAQPVARLLGKLRAGGRLRTPHPSREQAAAEVAARRQAEEARRGARKPVGAHRAAGY